MHFRTVRSFFVAVVLGSGLSACATVNGMAVTKSSAAVDVTSKSVLVITVDLSHQDSTYYVPRAKVAFMEKPNAQSKADRQNFKIDEDGLTSTDTGHNTYVLRMALEPGKYTFMGISGDDGRFPFHGFFFLPLILDVDISPDSVVYGGRVTAVLRPLVGNEFRAGPIFPLIDQAATGVSDGTFDVNVIDESTADIPMIRATFGALQGAEFKTTLLPPFDRPKAQQWWESHGNAPDNDSSAVPDKAPANAANSK